jgi:tetratricopeptide (TPR) repeat protein
VFESWIAPFDSFEFDNEKILNTRLRVSNMDLMMADMVLGVDFFLSHRIYISHKGHTLYATYNGGPVFRLDQAGRIAARQRSEAAAQPARAASPVGQAPSDAESFSRRGASFAARREFGRAIEDFSKAIQLDPDDPQRYVDRGYAHLSAGQPILAMADFDQALKLTPGDPKALVGRGAMFLSSRDLVRAKADLDAAIKAAPDSAATAFQVARMWSDAGQTGRALRVLDGWITAHPDAAELTQALNGRCRIRAMAGTDLDRALADCDVALRRGPKVAALYDTRGLVYLRMGQFDAAIDNYDDALKLQPRLGRAPYGRGVAKKAKGLESEGQADIAAAVGINPGLPQFFKRLGLETGAQARAPAAGAGQ